MSMDLTGALKQIAIKSAISPRDGDFTKDGVIYCGKCKKQREAIVDIPGLGKTRVGCTCDCDEEMFKEEQDKKDKYNRFMQSNALRSAGVHDAFLKGSRFETSNMTDELCKAKRYADSWFSMKRENIGLLFTGDTGTGKTHAAACIVNELIDRQIPCIMTSFPRILNDKQISLKEFCKDMDNYDLVVIDDLGAERTSEYALEIVFTVVDERYKQKKPLIITTNLSMKDLENPDDVNHKRIYQRVLEMCTPMTFTGKNMRDDIRKEKLRKAMEEINGEE